MNTTGVAYYISSSQICSKGKLSDEEDLVCGAFDDNTEYGGPVTLLKILTALGHALQET